MLCEQEQKQREAEKGKLRNETQPVPRTHIIVISRLFHPTTGNRQAGRQARTHLRWLADAFETGVTRRLSMPVRGL